MIYIAIAALLALLYIGYRTIQTAQQLMDDENQF